MKRILLVLTFLAAGSMAMRAQEQPDIKFWTDGPLTFDDFQVRHLSLNPAYPESSIIPIDIAAGFQSKTVKGKQGNLKYQYSETRTYLDQLKSWYDPNYINSMSLAYAQGMFDIIEIARRQVIGVDTMSAYDAHQYRQRVLDSKIEQYQQETDYGRDSAMVRIYQAWNKTVLDSLPADRPHIVPKPGRNGFGIVYLLGYNGEKYFGPLADYFGPLHSFLFGFECYYGKAFLTLGGDFGRVAGGLRKDNFFHDPDKNYDWETTRPVTGGHFNVLAGYRVYDGPWVAAAPFAGIGVGYFDQFTGEKDKSGNIDSEQSGMRLSAGLNFYIKLGRGIEDYSYYEHGLMLSLFGARTNNEALGIPVWSANVGLSYMLGGWFSRNKKSGR